MCGANTRKSTLQAGLWTALRACRGAATRCLCGRRSAIARQLEIDILRALNRQDELRALIGDVLRLLKTALGCDAVGLRLRKGEDFPYFEQDGFDETFLHTENSLCARLADGSLARDPAGHATLECACGAVLTGRIDPRSPCFSAGGSFWTNDSTALLELPLADDPRINPRNRCITSGYQSFALVPLRAGKECVGLLQLNYREKGRLSAALLRACEELAAAIGVAVKRRLADQELAEGEQRLQKLVAAAQDAVVMLDPQGKISLWNDAAARMFGYSAADAIGRNVHTLLAPPRFHADYRQAFKHFRASGAGGAVGQVRELAALRKGGEEFPVELSLSAVWFQEGWHAIGFLRDVTQRKMLELQQMQYEVALEGQRQAMEELYSAAESATRAKSAFLANMSHEIRTPMTAILGHAEILAGQLDHPEHLQSLDIIHRNGQHLLTIINDILDLSKIEAGRCQIERRRCSPDAVIADVIALLRVRAVTKGLSLTLQFAGPVPETIISDPTYLRQILLNLVGNAIKFTEKGGVGVKVFMRGDDLNARLVCEVHDSGIGISPAQIENIFQPFVQAEASTTRRFGGTGLGLAIAKRLASLLGGDITVESQPGRGSCFTVTLDPGPLAGVPMLEHPRGRETTSVVIRAGAPVLRLDGRILLAEDSPDIQRFAGFLRTTAGATVTMVDDGRQALELVSAALADAPRQGTSRREPFDVILMDMQMPVMDGYQATRALRQAGYRGAIIALTAHAMVHDRQECLDAGCDDYVSKPIDRAALLSTLAATLKRQAHSGAAADSELGAAAKAGD
jgi:PAS domain S-box-containing protein